MAELSTSSKRNGQGPQSQEDATPADGPREEVGHTLEDAQEELKGDLIYDIEETPPWHVTIILGFQHYLTMFGSTLGIPLLLAMDLCMSDNLVDIGKLIQTEFFVSGLATLLQTTFGSRLPIVQGASISFLGPAQAILRAQSACPERLSANATEEDFEMRAEFWRSRMRLLQGAILIASLVEVFQLCPQVIIGFTGLIGFLLRFIGPLTIAPTLCLIGLSLFQTAAFFAGGNWLLAMVVIVSMTVFSQYLNRISVPLPGLSTEHKLVVVRFPVFKLLPVILSILLAWILAAILTASDSLLEGSPGRTDSRISVLTESPWFYIPYPFQWGTPVVTIAGVLGMIAGVLASTVESIGDYFACARVAGAPPPPDHAVNRGIGMEGIGCILAGFWGTGLGTTSYSQNIGAINITKVGSRRVIQFGALFMLFLGAFGKFGAFFATIPVPIIGGMFCILFGK
ncbi:Solute carrier family 23 member 2 [Holothuria leucospilota]|uniref:Solute carrier family 23 member 2 n=1 Tax=Holothuria leucospilota TaxID=206669 RepID=A0A9Q1BHN4_HOLLE|nr:Solute carrier family 23 member 2 [Holothuria leucospilota]